MTEHILHISLSEIEHILLVMLDKSKRAGITTFEITEDYYWNMPADRLYDVRSVPIESEMDIGQLSEDWKEVQEITKEDRELLGHDLVHLSAVLRAIGEKYGR